MTDRLSAYHTTKAVRLPQHLGNCLEGSNVTLDDNGNFAISGFEGFTVLTKDQAREVAAMLLDWANR